MGEVRVSVKLTNAADLALVRRSLMLPGDVRSLLANALENTDPRMDCRERRLLSNPAHPDQAVTKVK